MSGDLTSGAGTRAALDRAGITLRAKASLSAEPRPFLRWAGSKQRLLSQLVRYVPEHGGRYFEPFLGAGAMFFLLEPAAAWLSDTCEPLIETYDVVARRPEEVVEQLQAMDVLDRDFYYAVRARRPSNEVQRAARFLYLNRAGWNGLYRVNARGDFNVPYGRPRSGNIVDTSNLRACAELISRAQLSVGDFASLNDYVRAGDFVYFDPPYVTGHNNNGFVDYNENLFSWFDQIRLAELARDLQDRGAHVVVSNAHHEAVIALYPTFRVGEVVRTSALASTVSRRGKVSEAVFY